MATGGDSCSEGHEFESQHHILDGHFYTYSCCKNCNDVCLKKPEVNYKRGPGSPIFKKKTRSHNAFDAGPILQSRRICSCCLHTHHCERYKSSYVKSKTLNSFFLPR